MALGYGIACQIHVNSKSNLSTKLLGTLIRYLLQNNLCTVQSNYSVAKCNKEFNLNAYVQLKRVISGKMQLGGKDDAKLRKVDNDKLPPDVPK